LPRKAEAIVRVAKEPASKIFKINALPPSTRKVATFIKLHTLANVAHVRT
jgi:hypothetical protein